MKVLLLVNPQMTSRRSARFPLSLMTLAAALEGEAECRIVDGNVDRNYLTTLRTYLEHTRVDAVGVTVMGGPQLRSAIDCAGVIRAAAPDTPIVWGGYFPSLYRDAAMHAPYVDFAVRGPGEVAFAELLTALPQQDPAALAAIAGLSWKRRADAAIVHNDERSPRSAPRSRSLAAQTPPLLPYHLLGEPRAYLARTFLGRRTAAHQAAVGCRYRCTFCGVAAVFQGRTSLPTAARLRRDLSWLKHDLGADSLQFFDHNFFERETDMQPLLQVLAELELPWWCYARADALLDLSTASWALVRKSRLRMAYIGAESPNDAMLKSIRKGTSSDQTLAVAELCRRQGVIPELSFMVAPPENTEEETERTFEFIRELKRVNPAAEIIVYVYTPLPAEAWPATSRARASAPVLRDRHGELIRFPGSPEQWAEPQWVDYACHADAPWLSARLRRRIQDFVTVLGCRFPTVQDVRAPAWGKTALRTLAAWRYRWRRYGQPWELELSKKIIRLSDPRATGI